jgi:hypothetical protein
LRYLRKCNKKSQHNSTFWALILPTVEMVNQFSYRQLLEDMVFPAMKQT